MQQAQVGWDPISVNHPLAWETKFLMLYLLVVLGMWLVKSGKLTRQFWWPSTREFAPLPNANIAGDEVDLLAASGLVNRMPNNASVSPQGIRQADCTFLYRWEMCSTRVASLRRLALLTLLLTVFVFVSLMANLLAKVGEAKIVGAGFLAGSIAESLAPFALGNLVCAVLYATCFFEGGLQRRRASWSYFLRKSEKSSSLRMRSEICPLGIL
jgi:hypothetical protein